MLNICILNGHLGNDPEIRYSQSGDPIATFSLAFHSGREKAGWIQVTGFRKTAEVCQKYLHRGAKVTVVGALEYEKWDHQGETRTGYRLIANQIEFIKTDGRGFDEETVDDLPF
jgi:single-strand DNA-binding protein